MKHSELYGKSIRESFNNFNTRNPKVYRLFEKLALNLINDRGLEKISAKMICEQIRWLYVIEDKDEDFKINNNYTAFFARLFIKKHPEFEDYFDTRKLRSEEDGPYLITDENFQLSFI